MTLYSMPLGQLRRYFQWLSAWIVEGERLEGRFKSPYTSTPTDSRPGPAAASGAGA